MSDFINSTDTPPPKGRRISLRSQSDCRRALAVIWRDLEAGRIDDKRARTLIYLVQNASTVLDKSEIEEELASIRKTLAAAGLEVKV